MDIWGDFEKQQQYFDKKILFFQNVFYCNIGRQKLSCDESLRKIIKIRKY